jgi:aspartate racemase
MRPVGILGGMGPEASANVYLLMIQRAYRHAAQDMDAYPHILINNIPRPNIFQHFDRETGPYLGGQARLLEQAGAQAIGIACNSAHYFWPDVRAALSPQVWLVDMIAEVAASVRRNGFEHIGLLSSSMSRPLYERALAGQSCQAAALPVDEQEQVDAIILRILSGERTAELQARLCRLADEQMRRGAGCVVLGCTDLPLLLSAADVPYPLYTSNDVLAGVLFDFALGS